MGVLLKLSLFLLLGFTQPVDMSFSAIPEDLEGSGYDLESTSGSGDWSEQGENIKNHPNSKDVRISTPNAGTENISHGSSVLTVDNTQWLGEHGRSGLVLENSKGFLERKDVFAGVLAGGVTGVILAATLAAILIYKWQNKDDGGYIAGQHRASEEDCHTPRREGIV